MSSPFGFIVVSSQWTIDATSYPGTTIYVLNSCDDGRMLASVAMRALAQDDEEARNDNAVWFCSHPSLEKEISEYNPGCKPKILSSLDLTNRVEKALNYTCLFPKRSTEIFIVVDNERRLINSKYYRNRTEAEEVTRGYGDGSRVVTLT